MLADGEPQPGSPALSCKSRLGLHEGFEYALQVGDRDADPIVLHLDVGPTTQVIPVPVASFVNSPGETEGGKGIPDPDLVRRCTADNFRCEAFCERMIGRVKPDQSLALS